MNYYEQLNKELKQAGVPEQEWMGRIYQPIDTLVNTKFSSKPYIKILLGYLFKLKGNQCEMVVRALTEKGNNEAAPYLIELFKKREGLTDSNLWAVGRALRIINDKSTYDEIVSICKDRDINSMPKAELMLVLAKIKTEETFKILIDSLNEIETRGWAIEALGRRKDIRAIRFIDKIQVEKGKYEFKAKITALKRLNKL